MAQKSDTADVIYLLEVMATLEDCKGDWAALAAKHGIDKTNTYRRFKEIAERNGFSYENNKLHKIGENGMESNEAVQTPKKLTPAKRKKGTATPTHRKRKLTTLALKEEESEEGVEGLDELDRNKVEDLKMEQGDDGEDHEELAEDVA